MPKSMKKSSRARKGAKSKRSARKSRKSKSSVANGTGPGQWKTLNVRKNPVVVFEKTAKFNQNGVNVWLGANAQYIFNGGAIASSMPDWTVITSLYNRYKFMAVTYTWTLIDLGTVAGVDLSTARMPKMYIRYNYDSNLTNAQVPGKLQELDNVKTFSFSPEKTVVSYTYFPRTIEPVYLSAIATGYKLAKPQFIDVQYGTVPHYGMIVDVDFIANGLAITFDISYKTAFKYSA